MGDATPVPRDAESGLEQFTGIDGLVDALRGINDKRDQRTLIFAKGENTRHVRHAQVLNRWPVLTEGWAQRVEHRRVTSVDRTPGAATFGR
ncbi:MAG TPA: hypothetical protein VNT51_13570 [Miltoncostaeaceae bacterium]|nr:hypothetical protein [Miltoncostaeaceae bacterium]